MATINVTGTKRIVSNRKFEDYKSMKKHFSANYTNGIKELIFAGHQLTTATAVVLDGAEDVIALIAAEAVVFLSTIADDSNQDLKKVWVIYQDDTGEIKAVVEHLLNDTADTSVEAALGNEDIFDTIASGQGTTTCTMTALNPGLDAYNGKYLIIQSGNQVGEVHLITATSADNPTVLTVDPALGAAADADIAQIQDFPCDDFFRVREMYCEVAAIEAKTIRLGNDDSTAIYGSIGETARYMANSGFFTQPAATCRSFLGKIKASFPSENTVTVNVGAMVTVTFTPLEAHSDGESAAITVELPFDSELLWEPCIELEPATDVIIKVNKVNDALHESIFVEVTYLEAYL